MIVRRHRAQQCFEGHVFVADLLCYLVVPSLGAEAEAAIFEMEAWRALIEDYLHPVRIFRSLEQ